MVRLFRIEALSGNPGFAAYRHLFESPPIERRSHSQTEARGGVPNSAERSVTRESVELAAQAGNEVSSSAIVERQVVDDATQIAETTVLECLMQEATQEASSSAVAERQMVDRATRAAENAILKSLLEEAVQNVRPVTVRGPGFIVDWRIPEGLGDGLVIRSTPRRLTDEDLDIMDPDMALTRDVVGPSHGRRRHRDIKPRYVGLTVAEVEEYISARNRNKKVLQRLRERAESGDPDYRKFKHLFEREDAKKSQQPMGERASGGLSHSARRRARRAPVELTVQTAREALDGGRVSNPVGGRPRETSVELVVQTAAEAQSSNEASNSPLREAAATGLAVVARGVAVENVIDQLNNVDLDRVADQLTDLGGSVLSRLTDPHSK